jgi:hypothetical protein
MEILNPNTIEEFILSLARFSCDGTHYYRGQADNSWKIIPDIARNKNIKQIDFLLAMERELIDKFHVIVEQSKQGKVIKLVSGGYYDSWKLFLF